MGFSSQRTIEEHMHLRVLSRASALAVLQATLVERALAARWPDVTVERLTRSSDGRSRPADRSVGRRRQGPLHGGSVAGAPRRRGRPGHSFVEGPADRRATGHRDRRDARTRRPARRPAGPARGRCRTAHRRSPCCRLRRAAPGRSRDRAPRLLPWQVTRGSGRAGPRQHPDATAQARERRRRCADRGQGGARPAVVQRLAAPTTVAAVRAALGKCRWMVLPLKRASDGAGTRRARRGDRRRPTGPAGSFRRDHARADVGSRRSESGAFSNRSAEAAPRRSARRCSSATTAVWSACARTSRGAKTEVWKLEARDAASATDVSRRASVAAPRRARRRAPARHSRADAQRRRRILGRARRSAAVGLGRSGRPDRVGGRGPHLGAACRPRRLGERLRRRSRRQRARRTSTRSAGRPIRWQRLSHDRIGDPDALATYAVEEDAPTISSGRSHFYWTSGSAFAGRSRVIPASDPPGTPAARGARPAQFGRIWAQTAARASGWITNNGITHVTS